MKIDPREISSVAAAQAPRFDMYGGIHKALRALMADTLLAVGRVDVADALELAQVTQRLLELLDACRSHLQHENEFVHPAMQACAPGACDAAALEHEAHLRHIAALGDVVARLRACPVAAKPAVAAALYRELALFVAANLQHMHEEETAHNEVLWANYGDDELVAVHDALVASIPPGELLATARWLVPFANPAERAGLLQDLRGKAPAPAFQAILDTVRPHLTQREWEKLEAALG